MWLGIAIFLVAANLRTAVASVGPVHNDIRDALQMQQAGFRADWDRRADAFTLQGDAYDGTVDQAGAAREFSGANVIGRYTRQLEGGSVRVQAYYDRTDRFHPNAFKERLQTFDIEAQHPDDFLVSLLDAAPGAVCAAVKRQCESLRNPPKTAEELLATLEGQGLTQAVARLRQFIDLL